MVTLAAALLLSAGCRDATRDAPPSSGATGPTGSAASAGAPGRGAPAGGAGAPGPSGPTTTVAAHAPVAGMTAGSFAGPVPLPVQFAVSRAAEEIVPLAHGEMATVGPAASFEVRVGASLPGARLILLDAQDALVAGSGEAEIGRESRYTFVPAEPLRLGASYRLRLEGLESRNLPAADGTTYLSAEFPVQVAGSRPGTAAAPPRP